MKPLILSSCLAVLLVGCGRDEPPPNVPATPTQTTGYEGEPAPAGTATARGGDTGQVVVAFVDYAREPTRYMGKQVSVEATVAEVISDRAFWLDAGPQGRVLAVVREDVPRHEMIDINAGQRLRFDALVMPSTAMNQLAGTLEPDAKNAIQSTPAFLATYWRNVQMVGGQQGGGQQGGAR